MAKMPTRATFSGASLSGAALKAALTALWDAFNSSGLTDATRSSVTSTSTLTTGQCGMLMVDATSGSIVLTLPTSGTTTDEAIYTIRRLDSTANTVTVQRGGTDTIDGAASITIPANGVTEVRMPAGGTVWRTTVLSGGTSAAARSAIGLGSTDTPTFSGLNGGSLGMLRNRVINGDMRIDQRKEGASLTLTAGAALAYCVDRFYAYCTGANATVQRVAGTGSRQYHLQFTGAASVTGLGLGHRIEGVNVNDLNNTTATLSVVLANSLLTTVNWAAYYANSGDSFGTLASPTRTSIASGSFTVTSTMTKYSANLSIPAAAAGRGIEIVFTVGAQTSGTWTIGDVMLEAGTVATPFPVRPFQMELAMCQRYYSKSYDIGTAPNTATSVGAEAQRAVASALLQSAVKFKVTMRAAPNVTIYSTVTPSASTFRDATGAANGTVSAVNGVGMSGYTGFNASVAMTSTNAIEWQYTAESEL